MYVRFLFVRLGRPLCSFFFFFNDTATTEIYTLSLHDALPIFLDVFDDFLALVGFDAALNRDDLFHRSEEHTSELQSLAYLVCRLLLEKKKTMRYAHSLLHQLVPLDTRPISLSCALLLISHSEP